MKANNLNLCKNDAAELFSFLILLLHLHYHSVTSRQLIDHIEIQNSRKMSNIKWWHIRNDCSLLIAHKPILRSGRTMSNAVRQTANSMKRDKDQRNFKFDGSKKNYKTKLLHYYPMMTMNSQKPIENCLTLTRCLHTL